ncbi:MAG TPA: ExbD/TolR family protein [Candidatus Hypogeohydataceae bacterium YC38]|nr:biopolymer transporter ExbD [Candidatus Brocadiales bacterium]
MNFRTKRAIKQGINITSLVDMLFLLLIFFVITSTFVEQPNIKLELPSTKHVEASKFEDIILNISKEGRLYLQNQPIGVAELEAVLRSRVAERGDTALVLRADKEVPYGVVIGVMDVARSVGLKRITALTLSKEETP